MKIDMKWARGEAVFNQKDHHITLASVTGYYNPFDLYFPAGDDRSLYLRFADVDPEDLTSVLQFVKSYGPLGLGARNAAYWNEVERRYMHRRLRYVKAKSFVEGFAIGRKLGANEPMSEKETSDLDARQRTVRVWEREPDWAIRNFPASFDGNEVWLSPLGYRSLLLRNGEATEVDYDDAGDFWREVNLMKGLLYVWRETQDPDMDIEGIADWAPTFEAEMYSDEHFDHLLGTTRTDYLRSEEERLLKMPVEEVKRYAMDAISLFVENQLAGGLLLEVKCQGGKFVQQWSCHTLHTAMYFMLAMDLAGSLPPRRCENPKCGRFFIPSRPSKVYCDETCQNQDRVRRWRQSKRNQGEVD